MTSKNKPDNMKEVGEKLLSGEITGVWASKNGEPMHKIDPFADMEMVEREVFFFDELTHIGKKQILHLKNKAYMPESIANKFSYMPPMPASVGLIRKK